MNGHAGYWDPLPAARAVADTPVPEAVPNLVLAMPHPETYLTGCWAERNRRNVPGPFYGADTDTCWTGRMAAPDHVLYDDAYLDGDLGTDLRLYLHWLEEGRSPGPTEALPKL